MSKYYWDWQAYSRHVNKQASSQKQNTMTHSPSAQAAVITQRM